MGIPVSDIACAAIDGFHPARLHIVDIANDFGSVLDLATSYVVAGTRMAAKVMAELIAPVPGAV
jgi:hypothetical protein